MTDQSDHQPHIGYEDLREWIVKAQALGEVKVVKGANLHEDIGLAAEAILRAENGPCVIFDEIEGCAPGFRVLLICSPASART